MCYYSCYDYYAVLIYIFLISFRVFTSQMNHSSSPFGNISPYMHKVENTFLYKYVKKTTAELKAALNIFCVCCTEI